MICSACGEDKDLNRGFWLRHSFDPDKCAPCEDMMHARRASPGFRASLVTAALEYAMEGMLVVPFHTPVCVPGRTSCSCGAACTVSSGKHPRIRTDDSPSGFASADAAEIRRWWEWWPSANVAVATGLPSRLLVLDVDPGRGGTESLLKFSEAFGGLPDTRTVATSAGGFHLHFSYGGDVRSYNNVMPGLDVRARDGCATMPPSLHPSGAEYSWKDRRAPEPFPPDAARALAYLCRDLVPYGPA